MQMTDHLVGYLEGEPDAERHADLEVMCGRLATIIAGQRATELLEGDLPESGAVVVPEVWVWRLSKIDVGRKDRPMGPNPEGRLLMPVRVDYGPQVVSVVAEGEFESVTWTTAGFGYAGVGEATFACARHISGEHRRVETEPLTSMPSVITVSPKGRDELVAELTALAEAGRAAEWALRMHMEGYLGKCVDWAHRQVCREVSTADYHVPLLDQIKLDRIADEMLVGTEDHPGAVSQVIARCMKPAAFAKVDPLKYISSALRVAAGDAVRKELGDPRVGRSLRRLVETARPSNMAELIELYNELNPGTNLSTKRATAALTLGPDVMAGRYELRDSDGAITEGGDL